MQLILNPPIHLAELCMVQVGGQKEKGGGIVLDAGFTMQIY